LKEGEHICVKRKNQSRAEGGELAIPIEVKPNPILGNSKHKEAK
jgi:hypothetical protein